MKNELNFILLILTFGLSTWVLNATQPQDVIGANIEYFEYVIESFENSKKSILSELMEQINYFKSASTQPIAYRLENSDATVDPDYCLSHDGTAFTDEECLYIAEQLSLIYGLICASIT